MGGGVELLFLLAGERVTRVAGDQELPVQVDVNLPVIMRHVPDHHLLPAPFADQPARIDPGQVPEADPARADGAWSGGQQQMPQLLLGHVEDRGGVLGPGLRRRAAIQLAVAVFGVVGPHPITEDRCEGLQPQREHRLLPGRGGLAVGIACARPVVHRAGQPPARLPGGAGVAGQRAQQHLLDGQERALDLALLMGLIAGHPLAFDAECPGRRLHGRGGELQPLVQTQQAGHAVRGPGGRIGQHAHA